MKHLAIIVASATVGACLIVGGIAFAAGNMQNMPMSMGHGGGMAPGVFGTVSAINGTTLTVTSNGFGGFGRMHGSTSTAPATAQTSMTYTVNASNATVMKNGSSSSLSAVSVGDKVMVRGTVNGTSVTATSILDGMPMGGMRMHNGSSTPWHGSSSTPSNFMQGHSPAIQGNGEPVVGGTVTAINGSTLTVTNKSNVTYTVDGSSATVVKGNATSSLANVAVNDNILIQGTVNGTSVTASSIIDQGVSSTTTSATKPSGFVSKMFGGVGSFFQHLFGFF